MAKNPLAGPFFQSLKTASWRGVSFGVTGGEIRVGRRQAVHEYPNRDTVWVEDMGRATRRISVTGFLVGDDVIAQRERMIKACEAPGEGQLMHPSLGLLKVSLLDAPMRESRDFGRAFEISFVFVESGARVFPDAQASTASTVQASASTMMQAVIGDYITNAKKALSKGSAVLHQIVDTANGWCAQITNLAQDATNLNSMVKNLPQTAAGMYGRYFAGSLVGFKNVLVPTNAGTATVATLIAVGAAARANVAVKVAVLNTAANNGDPSATGAATQDVALALNSAIVNPADGVRMLGSLYGYAQTPVLGGSAINLAMLAGQRATLQLFRRASLQALSLTSSAYQPSSADDAAAVRNTVCSLIDAEITVAGDAGDDAGFVALRALRAAVAQDLAVRGAALPAMRQVTTPASVPSLALAQRLYRDPARADQLMVLANCPHPAFLPTSFRALSA